MNDLEDLTYRVVAQHVGPRSKDNPTLYLNIMIHGKRTRKCLHTRDKRIAVLRAIEHLKEQRDKKTSGKKISDLLKAASDLRGPKVTKGRIKQYTRGLERLIKAIGDIDIGKVGPEEAERFNTALYEITDAKSAAGKLSGRAINNTMEAVRACFNLALRQKWVSENPFKGFSKAVEVEHAPVVYLPDQLRKILEEAYKRGDDLGVIIEIFFYTGMRPKEGTQLLFEDISFEQNTVTLDASTTKKKRYKTIPLNNRCVELFRYMQSRYDKPMPLTTDQIEDAWAEVREKLGFKGRFYDLRKSVNTWLKFYCGLESSICKIILGHRNANDSNEMYYTGFIVGPVYEAMEKLVTILYPSGPPPLP
ncbi:MAG: tyrosine-type recombinase/integrase [Bacteroidetes bacterium]|nr:tyrosine-type recombinase/integrase [Bacteroidota bacterium]